MKTRFDRVFFENRWIQKKHRRRANWTIIGISTWWSSPYSYKYSFCFFGLEAHIWLEKILNEATVKSSDEGTERN
ncbi:hypothetical protein [Marivirga sp.]|uniref:hypothetical protein n=1 Tax=Marivirga sp. TaxID=2018662 RepID=UPI003DA74C0A